MGNSCKITAYIFMIFLLALALSSCDDDQFSYQEVHQLFNIETKLDKKPERLKLYMDVSRSMYNYFGKDVVGSDSSLKNMIVDIFTKRKALDVELYGFGKSLSSIGKNEAAFNKLLEEATYREDATIIDYPMEDIIKSSDSAALHFIITDGVQEPKDKILSTHTMDYYIHQANENGKSFGMFANKFNWKKLGNPSPVFIFMFYYPQYEEYVRDFVSGLKGNVFINSINPEYKTSFNVKTPNLLTYFQYNNVIAGEFEDVQQPVSLEFTIRKNLKYAFEESNLGMLNYKASVFERKLMRDENTGRMDFAEPEWRKTKEELISGIEYSSNDTVAPKQEIIRGTFAKNFSPNPEMFTAYKVVIYASTFPGWAYNMYTASKDIHDVSKAFGLDVVFRDLERSFNEQPALTAAYNFYIILR